VVASGQGLERDQGGIVVQAEAQVGGGGDLSGPRDADDVLPAEAG
jgi:hypothetical protein